MHNRQTPIQRRLENLDSRFQEVMIPDKHVVQVLTLGCRMDAPVVLASIDDVALQRASDVVGVAEIERPRQV